MSVVGVDLGTLNTVIAVARNRGVDVITNEVSNRATPSLVGFGPKSRYIGESAKTQEVSNLKNTVGSLVRLAGRSLNDPDVEVEKQYVGAQLVDISGQVGAEVKYLGKSEKFTSTQLIAMFLSKVKSTASAELRLPVQDVVISVPPWYTDSQRRSVLDAAEIAGLKVLRLINATTAAALGWGLTKNDLPSKEEKPRRTAFVDIGYSSYNVSVVEYRKGELAVKSTAWDRHFGGRDFDKAIIDHFAKEFQTKYKIDVNSNPKARFRLAVAAEKLKKVLSANAQAPISVESIMNDVDVSGMMKREELEELVAPLLDRITVPLEQALADAKLKIEDIDSIELIGGCTRVPSLKERIAKFFGKPLSFTLNQDEAIARGCAWACAIQSPVFRVRDFSIHDIVSYPILFKWEKSPDIPDEDTELTVFNKGNTMPSTKVLTFYRKQPFDLEAEYAKPDALPGAIKPWIGRFAVKGVKADEKNDFMICKLKARVNLHGVLTLDQGHAVEDVEVEEPIPEEEEKKEGDSKGHVRRAFDSVRHGIKRTFSGKEAPAPSPSAATTAESKGQEHTSSTAQEISGKSRQDEELTRDEQAMDTKEDSDKPKTRKVRKQVKKAELPIVSATASLDADLRSRAGDRENEMVMEDKLVADTEDKKNELESYIYELRGKIEEEYAEFSNEEEKEKLRAKLTDSEDWLYEDGEDASKAQYTAKMDEIRFIAGPIVQRYMDKIESERAAVQKAKEEEDAKKRAELEAKKKAEEEAKAKETAAKKEAEGSKEDSEMTDAPAESAQAEVEEMD